MKELSVTEQLKRVMLQSNRFQQIMRRFIKAEDASLSDRDFVQEVVRRYINYLNEPLVDVSE